MHQHAELLWVGNCEFCGHEHTRSTTCDAESVRAVQTEASLFDNACERWFAEHRKLIAQRRPLAA